MLIVLLLGRAMERKMFRGDPRRMERFRQRLHAWSWRAAGIALVLGILLALWLRGTASH
ncbi:hypothetical protein [Rhodanobacter ginsengiterrae]|uniref:hypothetical protein n=1 Tax=Rhodanobacter ginsengiterrae TaxID=2008451 RepID=UPI003CFA80A9